MDEGKKGRSEVAMLSGNDLWQVEQPTWALAPPPPDRWQTFRLGCHTYIQMHGIL